MFVFLRDEYLSSVLTWFFSKCAKYVMFLQVASMKNEKKEKFFSCSTLFNFLSWRFYGN